MPRDDSAYLLDMLLSARDALSFTEGMSFPLVWDAVRQDIPDLIDRLEPLVPPEDG